MPVTQSVRRAIEEGLRRIQYFKKKNLTGDYTRILVKANTEVNQAIFALSFRRREQSRSSEGAVIIMSLVWPVR